jgi:hypothetical protein
MFWGRPRLTADIDITIRLEPENVPGFCADMEQAGFRLRVSDRDGCVARTRVLPFLHQPTQLPLDVVLAGSGLEEQFLQRAVPVEIEGVTIPVIAAEDLVVLKILAGRPKDVEDVRSVLAERVDTLDLQRIRRTLSDLEAALSEAGLVALFEAEHGRAVRLRRARRVTEPEAPG